MKILVLCSQATNTGAKLRAEYIFKYLKKAGADAEYLTPPLKSMPFMLDFALSFFYYLFKLMNKKYDFIFVEKPYPNTIIPILLMKSDKTKIIIDIDDLDYEYRKGLLSKFIEYIQKQLIKFAWIITSHNDELIRLIKREYPAQMKNIYKLKQSADLELFSPKNADKQKVRSLKKQFKGKVILLYMAHLNIASSLSDIIKAIKLIKNEPFILLVIGGGPMLSYYKNITKNTNLQDKIIFLGQMNPKEMISYIYATDVCLVYYENKPVNKYRASMKLREYLALRKYVVANNTGDNKLFQNYIDLTKPTVNAFADAIKKRIKNIDKSNKKGYKFIRQCFNWEKEGNKFFEFLKENL